MQKFQYAPDVSPPFLLPGERIAVERSNAIPRRSGSHQGKGDQATKPSLHTGIALNVPPQDVIGARARFPKPMGPYKVLLAFGPNLVACEGDEWKRQRKLVAPAFSEVTDVWCLTLHIWDSDILL